MDINAIKSKLATLQSTTNTKDNFWKPEPGKQVVRIVPYKHNKDNPLLNCSFIITWVIIKLTFHLFHLEDQTQ